MAVGPEQVRLEELAGAMMYGIGEPVRYGCMAVCLWH